MLTLDELARIDYHQILNLSADELPLEVDPLELPDPNNNFEVNCFMDGLAAFYEYKPLKKTLLDTIQAVKTIGVNFKKYMRENCENGHPRWTMFWYGYSAEVNFLFAAWICYKVVINKHL